MPKDIICMSPSAVATTGAVIPLVDLADGNKAVIAVRRQRLSCVVCVSCCWREVPLTSRGRATAAMPGYWGRPSRRGLSPGAELASGRRVIGSSRTDVSRRELSRGRNEQILGDHAQKSR